MHQNSSILFRHEPIWVVFVPPGPDTFGIPLSTRLNLGKHLLTRIVPHQLGELLDICLCIIDRLHKGSKHYISYD